MSGKLVNVRAKKVPTLYEADESLYVGPHSWQTQVWARGVRRLMRPRAYTSWLREACSDVQVRGLEHLEKLNGPAVFIANHQSHIDTLVVNHAMPARVRDHLYFGAAQDRWFVKSRPGKKRKMELQPWYQSLVLGNFPILRGGGTRALSYARDLLDRGEHVFLFPEGTRSTNDALGQFKHGATLLALQAEVPVVPLYLSGLRSIRPKGSREAHRGTAGVDILPPMQFAADVEVANATAALHEQLCRLHVQHNPVVAEPTEERAA